MEFVESNAYTDIYLHVDKTLKNTVSSLFKLLVQPSPEKISQKVLKENDHIYDDIFVFVEIYFN